MDDRVWAKTGGKCWYDGKEASTVDHIIPTKRGGTKLIENLVPACRCNYQKHDRTLEEYRRFLGLKELSRLAGVRFTERHVEYLTRTGIELEVPVHVFWFETEVAREYIKAWSAQEFRRPLLDDLLELDETWKLFCRRFGALMSKTELNICKVVYVNSHAKGSAEDSSTVPSLARAAGVSKRGCNTNLGKLQETGFIISKPRYSQTNSNRIVGITLRLILNPFSAGEEQSRKAS